VWERTVDGRVLNFHLAGINNQNFIMQDQETGTWWQQVSGAAILGPLKGKRLTRVFHDELSFRAWKTELPGGRVLVPAGDSAWRRFSENWEAKTAHAPVRVHAALDDRLAPRAIVFGVVRDSSARAYPQDRVLAEAPLHDQVAGVPLVLLVGADGKSVRGFEARTGGKQLEFIRPSEGPPGVVRDVATGSAWDFRGVAIRGALAGNRLTPVYLLKDYWFDWKTYHPGTGLYQR